AMIEAELLVALAHRPSPTLPRRVIVFGLPSLPPFYVRMLASLSRQVDVHWHVPTPARGYFSDVVSARRVARKRDAALSAELLHLEAGHPLLAACGAVAADSLDVLTQELEAMGVVEVEPAGDLFRAPDGDTVLARLQRDILGAERGDHRGEASDDSVTILSCHGPMREVEVLRDHLVALLTSGGDLKPHDVVVMMPDVDAYAPLVEAAFTRDRHDPRYLPFTIADRAPRQAGPVIDAFLRILALAGGRARASELLDVLALEVVRRRFGIGPEQLDQVREWVATSGIRWGIDAAHRAAFGQPATSENTWRFGLDRLLLGFALPGEELHLFAGCLPFDDVEGQSAELLGRFAGFVERMAEVVRGLAEPRPMARWAEALEAALADLVEEDAEGSVEHQRVRDVVADLAQRAEASGLDAPVGIEALRLLLAQRLDDRGPAHGFLRGGITFCAMVPMRSIPFRVVVLLGMGDGAFPRHRRPLPMDLIARPGEGRPGDRSRRDDDRFLFLEAILAARERLIITYPGQSVRDNAALPPSVVVSELIDELVTSYGGDPHGGDPSAVHPGLVVRHPLQPFSRRYFDGSDPRLFSYETGLCRGARALASPSRGVAPLFTATLAADDEPDAVELGELRGFLQAPIGHLLRHRLGVDLRQRDPVAEDREPLELGPLERHAMGDMLLNLRLAGVPATETETLLRAAGVLAPGTLGRTDHDELIQGVEPLARGVSDLLAGGPEPDLELLDRLPGGELLVGRVGHRFARGLVRYQYAKVTGKQLVALWLDHLALCWGAEPGAARESHLLGRGDDGDPPEVIFRLGPVAEPARHLAELVDLYRLGQTEPLLLFPRSAWRYLRERRAGKSEASAEYQGRKKFRERELAYDPNLRRTFDDDGIFAAHAWVFPGAQSPDPLVLAERVFGPMLQHLSIRALPREGGGR
ncbi:MAG: exodeoxyribonuclease V subunit gamma, partial [Myxococcales bacterium]|nr:exodeoxyribonuclease V subunit gamma [Myxococcales bacterium]